ncbi:MAG TPA: CHRD domain-containing protein [Ignavibacteria bacterium]|nr:CHRD domain-containing protein [Ignavibacteria bacterium]
MKLNYSRILTLSFLSLLSVFFTRQNSSATIFTFNNVANAQQEVPVSAGSLGKGTAIATYDDVTNLLSYTVTFSNLLGNSTASHFHGPALPGANAGVQVGILIPTGVTSGTKTATATLTAAQETQLLSGLWYYNVHSSIFGGGEIRAQMIPKTSFGLKVIPQGFFNPSTIQLNSGDTVSVYARNSTFPYAIKDSAKAVIDASSFNGAFAFNQLYGGSYYLMVRHRNSVETWSESPQALVMGSTSFNYEFIYDITKAFGDNMIQVYTALDNGIPNYYGIYSGDLDQDGIIDASDLGAVENDALNNVSGYVNTDVTGDDFVDAGDLSIVENNIGVSPITP